MLVNPEHIFRRFLELNIQIQCETRLETCFLTLFARVGLVGKGVGVGTSKFIQSSTMTQVTILESIIAVGSLEPKF